ncbi:4Fe-4S dicluster domain-containing protein [Oceanospirillum multiglobuliferum]|uniref:4Fe-4S ferredoxin-type domain-containing protein n=1 Tax=Oceanospirillum multiglobuliferum TaxID=64969 RepID=A0A1T4S6Z8_9GAMM|nr:4Fe-4S binding protein [Oceanospirillum multiglobuliferum]OPX54419.1 hypothetical protein BTE48_14405 [Oceanospirillum multiglobuliferum]SKA24034.1 4Fe-4S dicluster domain-containing protein [Oceanospirillum multiglobuliferum]
MTVQSTEQQPLNQYARHHVLTALSRPQNLAAPSISYQSKGHLLMIGADDLARLAAVQLYALHGPQAVASLSLLITDPVQDLNNPALEEALKQTEKLPIAYGKPTQIKGYMGQFEVWVKAEGAETEEAIHLAPALIAKKQFDLIIDLGQTPSLSQELSPPGYFYIQGERYTQENSTTHKLHELLEQLPDYIGEFEKPMFLRVNHDLCAHSSRGLTGCTRCLDVCPADAIQSLNRQIEVDHYLCHGAGGCSTACPTGALSFAIPKSSMMLEYLQRLLKQYREQGGEQPVLVFHGADTEVNLEHWPAHLIPVELEEITSVGPELWLQAFCAGSEQVVLLTDAQTPDSLLTLLRKELKLAQSLLRAMGYAESALRLVEDQNALSANPYAHDATNSIKVPSLQNKVQLDPLAKRDLLLAAIDHLYQYAPETIEQLPLPAFAPFGQISVEADACTLCFSCVAVCPTASLSTTQTHPALNFTEANCVQCGLCQAACPEKAISLDTRFLFNADLRHAPRVVCQDEPFCCRDCGTAFAPARTVQRIKEKLQHHSMFAGDAIRRLELCEDCRVKDIYRDLVADPTKQLSI